MRQREGHQRTGPPPAEDIAAVAPAQMYLLALTANGIRVARKRQALGSYIASLRPQPDVRMITETHLYDNEVEPAQNLTYTYANRRSRSQAATQAWGGMLILVKLGGNFVKAND